VLNRAFYLIGGAALAWTLAFDGPVVAGGKAPAPVSAEVLESVGGLPPHLVGRFGEPAGFQQAADGRYFVFDRRGHRVSGIDRSMTTITPLVAIGHELGRILLPFGFDLGDGEFAVADAPGVAERVQVFTTSGSRLSAFMLGHRSEPRVQLDGIVLNGVGSMRFTADRTILLSQPDTGALVSEYDIRGRVLKTFGVLRPTAHDGDPQLRLALNAGLPVPIPGGGLYFVFQAGEPRFHRYGADGALLYERVIQGPELDPLLQSRPTTWPRRAGVSGGDIPIVRPIVRTAAVDPGGRLWISFTVPYTYVYDAEGEKARTVQFRGAGLLAPTSLSFARDGRLLVTPGCYIFRP
jgi:hypothetical protein